jgi:hypothetical protein
MQPNWNERPERGLLPRAPRRRAADGTGGGQGGSRCAYRRAKATKLAVEAREAAALAAAQAAEAAAREAALKAEQEARNAEFAERAAREATRKERGRPLAMPAMPPAKLESEKANRSSIGVVGLGSAAAVPCETT